MQMRSGSVAGIPAQSQLLPPLDRIAPLHADLAQMEVARLAKVVDQAHHVASGPGRRGPAHDPVCARIDRRPLGCFEIDARMPRIAQRSIDWVGRSEWVGPQ